jgi:hypothetical protein
MHWAASNGHVGVIALLAVREKRISVAPFYTPDDHFAKTGSGRT